MKYANVLLHLFSAYKIRNISFKNKNIDVRFRNLTFVNN